MAEIFGAFLLQNRKFLMHFDVKNFRKTPKRGSNFGTRLDIRVRNSRVNVDLVGGGVTGIV